MFVKLSAVAGAAVLSLIASTALAAGPVTAKLATPVTGVKKPIAGGAVFICSGDTCVASSPVSETFSRGACRQLSGAVGAVTSFTSGAKALTTEQLTSCSGK